MRTRVGAALGQAQDEAQRVELAGAAHPGKQAGHQAPGDQDAAQEARRAKARAQQRGRQLQHRVAQEEQACSAALSEHGHAGFFLLPNRGT